MNFYKSNKYTILWTVGYFIATWAIMRYMFDFDIFSRVRWWQLAHAHIHGFPGMVFGVLLLAAVPMYIATTVVIARTGAPLFTIKCPERIKNFFINAFTQTPMDDVAPKNTPTAEQPQPLPDQNTPSVPKDIPGELRVAYARAREHAPHMPQSAFDLGNMTRATVQKPIIEPTPDTPTPDIPIPTDFDITDTDDIIGDIPQFTDINFDDDDDDNTEIENVHNMNETVAPIIKFMESSGMPYTTNDDVVVTNKYAVVAHTDDDFWVADDENWFAAGKTRKSPIAAVLNAAATNNVQPVIYLGADNIMDIDDLRKQWESAGIRIITDLNELK